MKKDVLGVKIDDVNIDQTVNVVRGWLSKGGPASTAKRGEKHYIVTPNPEIVIMANEDKKLKNIINNADLAIPDGVGLKLAGDIENTTPGIDVMENLVKMAAEKGFTTGFLGGRDQVAKKTSECLKKKYPKLKVSFATSGGEVDEEGNILRAQREVSTKTIIISKEGSRPPKTDSNNNLPSTDILFVAFGPPKQEKWIAKNLAKLDVKVAMGVGGAFDYLSGRVPRAPKWIRSLGLEWLFRLIIQPWRLKRQLALVEYLWLLISHH